MVEGEAFCLGTICVPGSALRVACRSLSTLHPSLPQNQTRTDHKATGPAPALQQLVAPLDACENA